eukprot:3347571-Pyramimonas_sp.AAC.1
MGVTQWARVTHANADTGAFGGAPHGATKRVRGVLEWTWVTHAGGGTRAFVGASFGAKKRVR